MARFNPYKLAELTYMVARELGEVKLGRTTVDGGLLTETDTIRRTEPADFWNGGTFWILTNSIADSAVAASEIADFGSGIFTLTLADAFDPSETGDEYAVAGPRWTFWDYNQAVNNAILGLGKIVYVRTADITTAASQTEYPLVEKVGTTDLPVLIGTDAVLTRVRIQAVTDDSNNNLWQDINIPWHVRKGNISEMPLLIFDSQPPTGKALELTIMSQHPVLDRYSRYDWIELDEGVPFQLVVLKAARSLLQLKMGENFIHPRYSELYDQINEKLAGMEQKFSPIKERREPRFLDIPNERSSIYRDRISPFPPYDN